MSSFYNFFSKLIPKKSKGGSTIINYPNLGIKKPKAGFSNASADWSQIREAHYQNWFSDKNVYVWHEIIPFDPHIDIYVYPPSSELGRNFYTLVTSGMSDKRMYLPKGISSKYARAEIIFYVSDGSVEPYQIDKPWFANSISFFAHFPFNYNTWFAPSHTIPNGNPTTPIVEGSELTTALFLPPLFEKEDFRNGLRIVSEKVTFLWLTYITNDECDFKLEKGYEALVGLFNKQNFPQVFDPHRKSVLKKS